MVLSFQKLVTKYQHFLGIKPTMTKRDVPQDDGVLSSSRRTDRPFTIGFHRRRAPNVQQLISFLTRRSTSGRDNGATRIWV